MTKWVIKTKVTKFLSFNRFSLCFVWRNHHSKYCHMSIMKSLDEINLVVNVKTSLLKKLSKLGCFWGGCDGINQLNHINISVTVNLDLTLNKNNFISIGYILSIIESVRRGVSKKLTLWLWWYSGPLSLRFCFLQDICY